MSTMGFGTTRSSDPRPMVPGLARYYARAEELGYLLLRVVTGLMFIPHVWPKLMAGPAAIAVNVMAKRGVEPALPAAYLVTGLEVVAVICITLGLLTRPVALLLVIEFLVIVKSHLATGWGATAGGAEFAFLWLIVLVYILCRGGGRYSVDRKLGWEI